MTTQIDLSSAIVILEEALQLCKDADGRETDYQGNNKDRMRYSADTTRSLLYAAHVADLARAEIINTYHRFKGEDPPAINP